MMTKTEVFRQGILLLSLFLALGSASKKESEDIDDEDYQRVSLPQEGA